MPAVAIKQECGDGHRRLDLLSMQSLCYPWKTPKIDRYWKCPWYDTLTSKMTDWCTNIILFQEKANPYGATSLEQLGLQDEFLKRVKEEHNICGDSGPFCTLIDYTFFKASLNSTCHKVDSGISFSKFLPRIWNISSLPCLTRKRWRLHPLPHSSSPLSDGWVWGFVLLFLV